jgi:hypothetical protein
MVRLNQPLLIVPAWRRLLTGMPASAVVTLTALAHTATASAATTYSVAQDCSSAAYQNSLPWTFATSVGFSAIGSGSGSGSGSDSDSDSCASVGTILYEGGPEASSSTLEGGSFTLTPPPGETFNSWSGEESGNAQDFNGENSLSVALTSSGPGTADSSEMDLVSTVLTYNDPNNAKTQVVKTCKTIPAPVPTPVAHATTTDQGGFTMTLPAAGSRAVTVTAGTATSSQIVVTQAGWLYAPVTSPIEEATAL